MSITSDYVRNVFSRLSSAQPESFFGFVDEKVNWTVLGTHPLAGHYTSKDDFRRATSVRLRPLFNDTFRLLVRDVLISGDRAAVELYARATTRLGTPFDHDYCWICRFENEKIVEVRAYVDSALIARVIEEAS